jgi:hypothetical protein
MEVQAQEFPGVKKNFLIFRICVFWCIFRKNATKLFVKLDVWRTGRSEHRGFVIALSRTEIINAGCRTFAKLTIIDPICHHHHDILGSPTVVISE